MLEVQNLSMRFGGLLAVDEVSLDVQEHEIVSIIGPNGAGKTTVFNCMSGFYKPTARSCSRARKYRVNPTTRSPDWVWCALSSMCGCSAR